MQQSKKLSPRVKEHKKSLSENLLIGKKDLVKFCEGVACKWCYESQLQCKFIHHQVDISVTITHTATSGCTAQNTSAAAFFAAALATADYNVGYFASNLLQHLGVEYTQILHNHLAKKDKKVDKPRNKKMRSRRVQSDDIYSPGVH